MKWLILALAAVLTLYAFRSGRNVLSPGAQAPEIVAEQWLNADGAVRLADLKGKVVVIEFWATWCPPCKKSIPHLAKLHAAHAKDGLVILGISNEEVATVEAFVDKKMKMPYYVGIDDDMQTNDAWLEGVSGIPHAFLVDKSGTVVWAGNPLAERAAMDDAIKGVLAGTFDVEAAKNAAAGAKTYNDLRDGLQVAYRARDTEKLFASLDRMIALKPLDTFAYNIKRQMLIEFDRADDVPALDKKMERAFKDAPDALVELVTFELSKPLPDRDAGRLWRCVHRAAKITKRRDPEILVMLAQVQCEFGRIDAAVATQEEALLLIPPEAAGPYRKVLEYYKTARKLAGDAGSAEMPAP